MQFKNCGEAIASITQLLRVMKIIAILLTICGLQVSAHSGAQVTYSASNVTLDVVFRDVGKQTGYSFLFRPEDLSGAKKISIHVTNVTLDEFMKRCLDGQPLEYAVEGRSIFLSRKKENKSELGVKDRNFAPPIEILIRVTNEEGEPVAGVTVQVKGGKIAGATNGDGVAKVKAEPDATLVFTAINIISVEAEINNQRNLDVKVKGKTGKLDEVQVIAYGKTSQRFNVGNVATVKASDIQNQPVNNPLLALQGRVPGLFIVQSNGIPGGGLTIRIQGQNSIFNGNDPLYVIDGVPFPANNLTTLQGGSVLGNSGAVQGARTSVGNPLSNINPLDIESIEILKDADATAIYGSQAANGAILITTKKGRNGKTTFDINMQKGWSKVAHFMDLMNSNQYMEMRHESKINDNSSITDDDFDLNGLWDTTRYTDWQKELIGKTANYSNYSASISGGTNSLQYFVSGTIRKETTVFPGDFENKQTFVHFSVSNTSLNQRFKLQISGNYSTSENKLPTIDLGENLFLAPVAPGIYNDDGTLNWAPNPKANGNSSWSNPLANLYSPFENKTTSLVSNANISYKITEDLELRGNFGYTKINLDDYSASLPASAKPESLPFFSRIATFGFNTIESWIIEPQLLFKRKINLHQFDILVGATLQNKENDGKSVVASGQPNDQQIRNLASASTIIPGGSDYSIYKYAAAFGRINYTYNDKYLLNLSIRRDGSSRFGNKDQFNTFASVGMGWIFTQENLFNKKISFLSFGKLRGSYGTTGSDQIRDYSYLNLYSPTIVANPYQGTNGLRQTTLPNPYLQWEETKKLQIGLDLGFLHDRILLYSTYVRNRSSNQLLDYNLPIITGYERINTNFPATVQNSSWEFTLNTINVQKRNFRWSSNFNLTVPQNKLISFPDLKTSTYNNVVYVGQSLSVLRLHRYYGVDPNTGDFLFLDKSDKPTPTPDNDGDLISFCNLFPKLYGGLQNTFSFRGFQVDFLVQFTKQNGFNFYENTAHPGDFAQGRGNQPRAAIDRWRKPGDISFYERYTSMSIMGGYSGDRTYEDISFVRLKNLAISYQLPEVVLKSLHLSKLRFLLSGQNLLTITRYKGLDPENLSTSSVPPLRVITMGLQLSF